MAEKKKSIVVRVDDELHQQIKIFAISKGKNLQEYVLDLIKKDMEKKENND